MALLGRLTGRWRCRNKSVLLSLCRHYSEEPTAAVNLKTEDERDTGQASDVLTDSFGRRHNYLRISLTERCNLRCKS